MGFSWSFNPVSMQFQPGFTAVYAIVYMICLGVHVYWCFPRPVQPAKQVQVYTDQECRDICWSQICTHAGWAPFNRALRGRGPNGIQYPPAKLPKPRKKALTGLAAIYIAACAAKLAADNAASESLGSGAGMTGVTVGELPPRRSTHLILPRSPAASASNDITPASSTSPRPPPRNTSTHALSALSVVPIFTQPPTPTSSNGVTSQAGDVTASPPRQIGMRRSASSMSLATTVTPPVRAPDPPKRQLFATKAGHLGQIEATSAGVPSKVGDCTTSPARQTGMRRSALSMSLSQTPPVRAPVPSKSQLSATKAGHIGQLEPTPTSFGGVTSQAGDFTASPPSHTGMTRSASSMSLSATSTVHSAFPPQRQLLATKADQIGQITTKEGISAHVPIRVDVSFAMSPPLSTTPTPSVHASVPPRRQLSATTAGHMAHNTETKEGSAEEPIPVNVPAGGTTTATYTLAKQSSSIKEKYGALKLHLAELTTKVKGKTLKNGRSLSAVGPVPRSPSPTRTTLVRASS
ncbi:hypothetical protein ABBQ38_007003 [Trebouxia sp. C0009 RCD-2024]